MYVPFWLCLRGFFCFSSVIILTYICFVGANELMPSPFSKGGLDGGILEQELHMCLQMLTLKFHYQNKPLLPCLFLLYCPHAGSSSSSPLSSKLSPFHHFHHRVLLLEMKIHFCEHPHSTWVVFFKNYCQTQLTTASSHIYSSVIKMFICTWQENTTNSFPAPNFITGISDYFIWCCKQIPSIVKD